MRTRSLFLTAAVAVSACLGAAAQGPRREVKWNNPDGPKVPSVERNLGACYRQTSPQFVDFLAGSFTP